MKLGDTRRLSLKIKEKDRRIGNKDSTTIGEGYEKVVIESDR